MIYKYPLIAILKTLPMTFKYIYMVCIITLISILYMPRQSSGYIVIFLQICPVIAIESVYKNMVHIYICLNRACLYTKTQEIDIAVSRMDQQ